MTPSRWPEISAVYNAAAARTGADRIAYLSQVCGSDEELRKEVDALLARGESFLANPIALPTGSRLGPFELLSVLGAGGMGVVYRGRDTKLQRDVALKVLPDAFALDPDRLARFRREAQVLASLNHPNIAAIYGFEESEGVQALVLELVEGPTLADRIAQGLIPLDETLPIARQICDALEAAHEQGIIHRDLKPANIKLRPDGTVKVLDFGLAKALEPARTTQQAAGHASLSPTITSPAMMTGIGVLLGTAAYMSPEQAKGKPADRRSDIWAFGCVVYETLTGKRAFDGDDVADTLANVLKTQPDWSALPSDLPKPILTLLRRCLEKGRLKRIADISTALFVIDEQANLASPAPKGAAPIAPSLWLRFGVPVVVALAAAATTAGIVWFQTRPVPPLVSRLAITPPPSAALTVSGGERDLAIAPDGRTIVYVGGGAINNSSYGLFVRALDRLDSIPLTGLGLPHSPFLSPDGQWIGFFNSNADIRKVAITGGPAIFVSRIDGAIAAMGATWGADGTIVFASTNSATGLSRVSADGGSASILTRPNRDAGEADHVWPEFLPGRRSVLFTITSTSGQMDDAQIAVLDLQTGSQKILLRGGSHGHYLSSGHLVYGTSGTIRAVAFDVDRLEVVGVPVPVLSQVVTTGSGSANFDVSRNGTLAYVTGGVQTVARTLVWVDRQGHEEPLNAPERAYLYPRLSPNGSRIALDIRDQDNDIWMWDVVRKTLARFTSDLAADRFPVWTHDGQRVIFNSDRDGANNLYWQVADGTAPAERLTQSPNGHFPTAVSPDGTRLLFAESVGTKPRDLMMLTLDKERRAQPLVQTPSVDQNGQVSPDARWLVYDSDETGRFEIYVRPFPDVNGGHWQVSNAGGIQPLWSRNGQELFYLSPTGAMMAVPIGKGPQWSAGAPVKLFEGQYARGNTAAAPTYDVSPDGRRFLMIRPPAESPQNTTPASLIIVQNWFEELNRLVPTK